MCFVGIVPHFLYDLSRIPIKFNHAYANETIFLQVHDMIEPVKLYYIYQCNKIRHNGDFGLN